MEAHCKIMLKDGKIRVSDALQESRGLWFVEMASVALNKLR